MNAMGLREVFLHLISLISDHWPTVWSLMIDRVTIVIVNNRLYDHQWSMANCPRLMADYLWSSTTTAGRSTMIISCPLPLDFSFVSPSFSHKWKIKMKPLILGASTLKYGVDCASHGSLDALRHHYRSLVISFCFFFLSLFSLIFLLPSPSFFMEKKKKTVT